MCQRSTTCCRGLAVLRSQFNDDRVCKRVPHRVRVGRGIHVHATERRPRLGDNAVARVGITQLPLDEERVELDLMYRRHDVDAHDQVFQVLRAVIADTDRAHPAFSKQRLGRPIRRHGRCEVRRHRPVQKIQVRVIQPEPAQACIACAEGSLVTVVADPQLGRDEKLGASDPASHDAFANLPLVRIRRRGVDEPIPVVYRAFHSIRGPFRGAPIQCPEPEGRHRDAVVKRDKGTSSSHKCSSPARHVPV
jgi:hypothetical protein